MDVLIGFIRLLSWIARHLFAVSFWLLKLPFRLRRNGLRKGGSHGSARWSTRFEQWWHGAIRGEGILLGRGAFRRFVRFSYDGLVMVFASTGAGKGLGVVVPALLTYRGSMVCTDPKGENYAITRRRRAKFGKVRMMNPSDLSRSERLNPLSIVRTGTPSEVDDAAALASLMVKPDAVESHWDTKAISILKALILHTLQEPPASRTLATVRRLSIGSPEVFVATFKDIAEESPSLAAREIASGALTASINSKGDFTPEFSSILSNVQKATEPWSAGAPAGVLSSSSTFDLTELVTEVSTLFLCVDEDVLDVYDVWLRVMVGCIIKTMTRAKLRPPKRKVVLLLDEVAVLGRMAPLEKQSGLLRAYCTPVLIWQNLPQIYNTYKEGAEAFLANATARVFFGVNDNATASYVATMIGNTTTLSSSTGTSKSSDGWMPSNRQEGQSESGYWLLDAAEVQRLPPTKVIIKLRNVPYSILGKRVDYRAVRRWRSWWDEWRKGEPEPMAAEPQTPLRPALPETEQQLPQIPPPPSSSGLSASAP